MTLRIGQTSFASSGVTAPHAPVTLPLLFDTLAHDIMMRPEAMPFRSSPLIGFKPALLPSGFLLKTPGWSLTRPGVRHLLGAPKVTAPASHSRRPNLDLISAAIFAAARAVSSAGSHAAALRISSHGAPVASSAVPKMHPGATREVSPSTISDTRLVTLPSAKSLQNTSTSADFPKSARDHTAAASGADRFRFVPTSIFARTRSTSPLAVVPLISKALAILPNTTAAATITQNEIEILLHAAILAGLDTSSTLLQNTFYTAQSLKQHLLEIRNVVKTSSLSLSSKNQIDSKLTLLTTQLSVLPPSALVSLEEWQSVFRPGVLVGQDPTQTKIFHEVIRLSQNGLNVHVPQPQELRHVFLSRFVDLRAAPLFDDTREVPLDMSAPLRLSHISETNPDSEGGDEGRQQQQPQQ